MKLVGGPLPIIVVTVLVVGLTSYALIQYGKNIQEQENLNQRLQNNVETRERIDDAISNSPSDPNDALEFLRDRQSE